MALRNHAEMARSGSVSTAISPTDRLSLLPKELLDMIYSLVFKFDDGPSTIHIKPNVQPSKYAGYSRSDPDPMLSILALPRDRKYKALRRENPDEKWPANVEEDFFRALDWAYRHRPHGDRLPQYYNETISEIIYELTGIRHCRKNVSSHIQTLKQWVHDIKPESEQLLISVSESISAVQNLDASNDMEKIAETITRIQSKLPNLESAFQKEHDATIPIPTRPISLDFHSSPTITPNGEIFHTLSTIAVPPMRPSPSPYTRPNPPTSSP